MTDLYANAERVFARALEVPPGSGRDRLVGELCADDPALRREVESLLRAHEAADSFLGEATDRERRGPLASTTDSPRSTAVASPAVQAEFFLRGAGATDADAQVRRRVIEEARSAAGLSDPAIVTIHAVLDEADPPAIVMELVEGFPLDRFAAQLNFEQKARLLREVARALMVAHSHGLVHRDLKPANIIVGPDMRPRVLDFGLALSLDEARRQGRGFEGTPLYASPEQVLGQPLQAASDVFSSGSLMFKVLTGKPPFAGDTASQVLEAIATTAPPFLREVAVGVPEDLQAICLACLAWDPADRPRAEEVALELGRFLVGEPVRLKPKLYDDLLRRSISEYSCQARAWESQSIISGEEHDSLAILHRRLLADEDHWIIDARRITPLQTILSGATWLTVVATVLTVWMLREELVAPWRWLVPGFFTAALLLAGHTARRERDSLAAATFLAGAALAIAPGSLALVGGLDVIALNGPTLRMLGVTEARWAYFDDDRQKALSVVLNGVVFLGLMLATERSRSLDIAALGTFAYVGRAPRPGGPPEPGRAPAGGGLRGERLSDHGIRNDRQNEAQDEEHDRAL